MVEVVFQGRGEGGFQIDPGAGGGLGEAELGGVEEVAVGVERREFEFVDDEVILRTMRKPRSRGKYAIDAMKRRRASERVPVAAQLMPKLK